MEFQTGWILFLGDEVLREHNHTVTLLSSSIRNVDVDVDIDME
jgi:hypothetical protein